MIAVSTLIRSTDEAETRAFCGGGVHRWLVRPEETGGAYLLIEDTVTQGKATPLHVHPLSDETFYVLEGAILVHADGVTTPVVAGGVAMVPRGVPHAFAVTSPTARLLCLHTPGECGQFYLDASDVVGPDGVVDGPPDLARLRAAAAADPGIELVGPPPF